MVKKTVVSVFFGCCVGILIAESVIESPISVHASEQKRVEHVSSLAQLSIMLSSCKKVILKFSAVWCGPCRASLPLFEELSGNNNYQNVTFVEIDVEKGGEIANRYVIRGIPAFVCLSGNKVVGKIVGFDQSTRGKLIRLLDDLVKA